MHYFAQGAVVSHAHFHVARVNVPVHVEGLVVLPGDLLHGDENGLITVPKRPVEEIARAVDGVRSREKKLMDYVRSDAFTIDGLRDKFLE